MRKFVCSVLLSFSLFYSLTAQETSQSRQFEVAQEKSTSGDYEGAIVLLKKLIEAYPENTEYKLYLARVYSWNKNYPEAIEILEPLAEGQDYNSEAMEILVSVNLWAGNYAEVIQYAGIALNKQNIKNNNFYKIQKANAHIALKEEKKAMETLEEILSMDPDHQEALYLQTEIYKGRTQHLSLSYLNTSFSQPGSSPRHMAHLEYKRNLVSVPVLARFNYGHLNGKAGGLLEVDAYPRIARNSYLFLNAGVALDTPIFPEFRGGIEYFVALANGIGASVGGKYLQFAQDEVLMFTGELSYYTRKDMKLSYRPFLSESEDQWFLSHALGIRLMNPVKESFWQLDLQYGSIPFGIYTSQDFKDLSAFRIGLQHQFRLGNFLVQPVFMYEYEEYLPSEFRNRFNVQLITTLRF